MALRTLLRLLEWYQEPPPAHAARVEKTLRETGALASVLRLLPSHSVRVMVRN